MKKKSLLFFLLLVLTLIPSSVVRANEVSLSPYVKVISEPVVPYVKETIDGGAVYTQRNLKTLFRGDLADQKWQDQTVSTVSADASNVQVVTWQKTGTTGWGGATLRETIVDFESKNPGYMVIAGVNGDFADIGATTMTYQSANTFVRNGDIIKKDTASSSNKGVLGFSEFGKGYVVGRPKASDNIYLKIYQNQSYDNDDIIDEIKIDSINSLDSEGITLLYPGVGKINVEGATIYKGEYIEYKTSNDYYPTTNSILGSFLKGQIVDVITNLSMIDGVNEGEFYLADYSGQLNSKLAVGTTLKCEYKLLGEFDGIYNTLGYTHKILSDGVPMYQGKAYASDTFVSSIHPRTVIGFKADHSPVLMVIDGRGPVNSQRTGVTLFEAGELLRLNDCVQGFNLDGGGSSTMIIRDETGKLVVVNTPSDGHERVVGICVLFVIQKPNIEITNITDSSITVEQTAPIVKGTLENIEIRLDGQTYPMTNGKVGISRLSKGTEYNFSYTYDLVYNGERYNGLSRRVVIKTDEFTTPEIKKFAFGKVNNNEITFDYRINDVDNRITRAYIEFNNFKVDVAVDETQAKVTNLPLNEEIAFKLVLEYADKTIVSDVLTKTLTGGGSSGGGCNAGANAISIFAGIGSLAGIIYISLRRK